MAFSPQALPAEFTSAILAERGVSELMKAVHVTAIPEYYVHPESVKLRQQQESMAESDVLENCLQVIDLAASCEDLVRDIGKACGWGFFQIINHGICPELIEKIAADSKEFFLRPLEEKLRCSTPQKVAGPIHFGDGSKGDWRDVLKINIEPASAVAMDYWPMQPIGFRETLLQYTAQNKVLVKRLLGLISESLRLESDYIENDCGEDARVLMAINHYPPCPDPSLTMGIREHSDPNTITILLQDHVAGLQMKKDGVWFAVKALEGSLIVNAGDHLQILSNGRYPSCLHRVVTNKSYPRTSVALFYSPSHSSSIKPASALVDEEHSAQYREFVYGQYLKNFYQNGGPNSKVILGQFKSETEKPRKGVLLGEQCPEGYDLHPSTGQAGLLG